MKDTKAKISNGKVIEYGASLASSKDLGRGPKKMRITGQKV